MKSGDYRQALEALRDELVDTFMAAPATVKPQHAGRLQAVLEALRQLDASESLGRERREAAARAKAEQEAPTVVPQTAVEIARAKRADRIATPAAVVPARRAGRK